MDSKMDCERFEKSGANGFNGVGRDAEETSSVVKLLSRKLSGLGIYKKAVDGLKDGLRERTLRGGGGMHFKSRGNSVDRDSSPRSYQREKRTTTNGPVDGPTNGSSQGLSVIGRKGTWEAKAGTQQAQQRQQQQPPHQQQQHLLRGQQQMEEKEQKRQADNQTQHAGVIMGKFTTSYSLSASLIDSRSNPLEENHDHNNNYDDKNISNFDNIRNDNDDKNGRHNTGKASLTHNSTSNNSRLLMTQDSLNAKKEFETHLKSTTSSPRKSDDAFDSSTTSKGASLTGSGGGGGGGKGG